MAIGNAVLPNSSSTTCMVGCPITSCPSSILNGGSPITPIDGVESLGPWVQVTFSDNQGFRLTVGNASFPNGSGAEANSAVIRDFEFGQSTGVGVKMTILDQQGGVLSKLTKRINTNPNNAIDDYVLQIQFGWISSLCSGGATFIKQSDIITFIALSISVSYADGGKIVYDIEGGDLLTHIKSSKVSKSYGSNDAPLPLQTAITDMFEDHDPEPGGIIVEFRSMNTGDVWNFQGGPNNPAGCWTGSMQDKVSTALGWMRGYLTENNKGCTTYTWNASSDLGPTIIFWEDPWPGNYETLDPTCLGTYIVNGSKCSPVISFMPTAKFAYVFPQYQQAGGGATTTSSQGVQSQGAVKGQDQPGQGASVPLLDPIKDWYLQSNGMNLAAAQAAIKAVARNSLWPFPYGESVEADLVIQGDPSSYYTDITQYYGKTLSIIMVNPFYLSSGIMDLPTLGVTVGPPGGCPIWLAYPPCNPIFSNRYWYIQKVNHSIKAGSYLTTIKLRLPVPGLDVPDGTLSLAQGQGFGNQ